MVDRFWYLNSYFQYHANVSQPKEIDGCEQGIYSGNEMLSHVEVVWTFRLILNNGYILDLENTFYVTSF